MLLGPIGHVELVKLARRKRTFVLRFAVGLGVLLIFWGVSSTPATRGRSWYGTGSYSSQALAEMGRTLFETILYVQATLVTMLLPLLLVDALAVERRRKTLHDLLTTCLSGGEIVRGKLIARLAELGSYFLLVVPMTSLLTLFGGVSPADLVLGSLSVVSWAYMLGCAAILAAVLCRKIERAAMCGYGFGAVLLLGPLVFGGWQNSTLLPSRWLGVAGAIHNVGAWLWPAGPYDLISRFVGGAQGGLGRLAAWVLGSHAAYGTLFLTLAGWQLRPAYRRHEGGEARANAARFTREMTRTAPVRPCGDDPIFWKETCFPGAGGGLLGSVPKRVSFTVLGLAMLGLIYASRGAFDELWTVGSYWTDAGASDERRALNFSLRVVSGFVAFVALVSVAGAAARTVPFEHEHDTWVSLAATPLERDAIVRGKLLGVLWNSAPLGAFLVAAWILGVLAGAVHPLGLFAALLAGAVLVWFTAALGFHVAVRSRTSWRAGAVAQGIVVATHLCCMVPVPSAGVLIGAALLSYAEIHPREHGSPGPTLMPDGGALVVMGLVIYTFAAVVLTRAARDGLDRLLDRPRR